MYILILLPFLKTLKLKAELKIQNLPIDLIPLEKDLLSIEENNSVEELYLKDNNRILSVLVRSIVKFETVFGKIKFKYAKGEKSKILKKLLEEEEEISPFETEDEILGAVMLDRSVDFITPLCTQYTYEGMIDEYLGINYSTLIFKLKT